MDTTPEVALRAALHALGLRFFKDRPTAVANRKVRPDVVFPRARVAVFVDGCFWHACPLHGTVPRNNGDYWRTKLARNVERDRETTEALQAAGWSVVRVWEHEAPERAAERVARLIRPVAPAPLDCHGSSHPDRPLIGHHSFTIRMASAHASALSDAIDDACDAWGRFADLLPGFREQAP